jgi:hypothetical protein
MASGNFVISTNMAGSVTQTNGYWSTTTDAANNRSFLTAQYFVTKASGFSSTFGTGTFGINVDGVAYQQTKSITIPAGPSTTLVYTTPTITINHNSNGSRSVPISVFGGIPNTSWTTTTGSTTAVLDDYDRSPVFTTANAPTPVIRGVSYSGQFTATNTSSYTRTGTLPPGLTFNTSTGALTGTPNTVGSYSFTITANGAFEGSASVSRTVVVNPALPAFSDATVEPTANVGIAYSDGVAASETASYSVFSGALPTGLSLNTSTGAITGTPTTPGTFTFVIRATNVTGSTNTGTLTITAISAARVWNGTAFVSGLANVWNGTAFVSGIIKVWDGTTWKNTN